MLYKTNKELVPVTGIYPHIVIQGYPGVRGGLGLPGTKGMKGMKGDMGDMGMKGESGTKGNRGRIGKHLDQYVHVHMTA